MLSFRRALWLYVVAVAGLTYLVIFHHFSFGWISWLTAALIAFIGYGSARISSCFFVPVRYQGPADQRHIALTFDDGPTEQTLEILAILRRQAVPATFFCIGQRVRQQPAIVQQMQVEGHLIANHSFSHGYFFDLLSTNQFWHELQQTDEAIQKAIGRRPRLFRPPYGVTTPGLAAAIRQGGYTCVGWNVRTMDTVTPDATQLRHRAVKGLAPGTIFLFHDHVTATARMLEDFIIEARSQNYEFVPLDRLLNLQPYA